MAGLTLELPSQKTQTEYNLRRWAELLKDRELAISPSNAKAEIAEKMVLYFDTGAREVWLCTKEGEMRFFVGSSARDLKTSKLCPDFPKQIELP